MDKANQYIPYRVRIAKRTQESSSIQTFRLEFVDEADAENFHLHSIGVGDAARAAAQARMADGASAHGAGLKGDIQLATLKTIVT